VANFSYISYKIQKKEEINEKEMEFFLTINSVKVKVFYSDVSLLIRNYDSPVENFISYFEQEIQYTHYFVSKIAMSKIELNTDYAYAFENNIDYWVGLQHHTTTTTFTNRPLESSDYLNIDIEASKYFYSYSRYYMKIP
jgi:hypothetical protein